jgi:hypothetical protein
MEHCCHYPCAGFISAITIPSATHISHYGFSHPLWQHIPAPTLTEQPSYYDILLVVTFTTPCCIHTSVVAPHSHISVSSAIHISIMHGMYIFAISTYGSTLYVLPSQQQYFYSHLNTKFGILVMTASIWRKPLILSLGVT